MNKKAIFLLAIGIFFSTDCVFGMERVFEIEIEAKKKQFDCGGYLARDKYGFLYEAYFYAKIINFLSLEEPPFNYIIELPLNKKIKVVLNISAHNETEKTKEIDKLKVKRDKALSELMVNIQNSMERLEEIAKLGGIYGHVSLLDQTIVAFCCCLAPCCLKKTSDRIVCVEDVKDRSLEENRAYYKAWREIHIKSSQHTFYQPNRYFLTL